MDVSGRESLKLGVRGSLVQTLNRSAKRGNLGITVMAAGKKPRKPDIQTVGHHIAWSYANLARADAALQDGDSSYKRIHHIIRSRLFNGLKSGTMAMRSLYDDERIKMTAPKACCYCGSVEHLAVDHLIPRIKGGGDDSDNLILACRTCNSSKQGRDLLEWMTKKETFPSVMILRRYLKLVARYCDKHDLLEVAMPEAIRMDLPFDLSLLPHTFPPVSELVLWVYPKNDKTS